MIFFAFSERDADVLKQMGLTVATAKGSGWRKEMAVKLRGREVVILPRNCEGDEKLAERICSDLRDCAFRRAILPKLCPEKDGGVAEFEAAGGTREELLQRADALTFMSASWAYLNQRGEMQVKPSMLADAFSRNEKFIIVRNPLDDNDLFYLFRGGVYRRQNKAQLKGLLREWVPICYQRDSQIAEAMRTLFELGGKVHEFEQLDADERFVNFRNGLLDLQSWNLVKHSPDVLSTLQLPYSLDPAAHDMPVFDAFRRDFFTREDGHVDADDEKILQEFLGLAISNVYFYRVKKAMFLCSICGNTGKTLLMNLLQTILGEENITSVPLQNMNEASGRFTIGTALGKRMIINGDQSGSVVCDSSIFKQLTGGDRTKMEAKGRQPLMVRYRGGILVSCNGLPSFSDDKGAHVFERILLIRSTNVIPPERRDPELLDRMRPEIPAIINWCLAGLRRLQANGWKFTRSASSEEAGEEYRMQLDSVYRFIHEYERDGRRFEITGNRADQYPKAEFYAAYEVWCKDPEVDVSPVKRKNLDARLIGMGLETDRHGNAGRRRGIYTIRGLRFEPETSGLFDGKSPPGGQKSPLPAPEFVRAGVYEEIPFR